MPPQIDLTGQIFGKYTVLRPIKKNAQWYWICRCECGRLVSVFSGSLRSGRSKGCINCAKITRGDSKTPLHRVWIRITLTKHGCCKAWKQYETFRTWALTNGWKHGLWVHRKGDTGKYSPGNCYIGPRCEGARHGQSKNAALVPEDTPKIRCLAKQGFSNVEIAKQFNVCYGTIWCVTTGRTWKNY